MKYECPICGGTAIPHYTYGSKRSITYKGVKVICNDCGYEGATHDGLYEAVRDFRRKYD